MKFPDPFGIVLKFEQLCRSTSIKVVIKNIYLGIRLRISHLCNCNTCKLTRDLQRCISITKFLQVSKRISSQINNSRFFIKHFSVEECVASEKMYSRLLVIFEIELPLL